MLADGARIGQDNKLYIFGGQWDQLWTPTVPTTQKLAVALVIAVPYTDALKEHTIELILDDQDGKPIGTRIGAVFRPGHPPLTEPGSEVIVPIAMEPPPIPIPDYGRYNWRIVIDNKPAGDLPMNVRPQQFPPIFPQAAEADDPS